jgi:hypothetical protein
LVEKDLEAEQGQDDQGSGDGCGVYRVEHMEGARRVFENTSIISSVVVQLIREDLNSFELACKM